MVGILWRKINPKEGKKQVRYVFLPNYVPVACHLLQVESHKALHDPAPSPSPQPLLLVLSYIGLLAGGTLGLSIVPGIAPGIFLSL